VQQNHEFMTITAVIIFFIVSTHQRAVYSDKHRAVILRPYLRLTYEQFYELPQQETISVYTGSSHASGLRRKLEW